MGTPRAGLLEVGISVLGLGIASPHPNLPLGKPYPEVVAVVQVKSLQT